MRKFRLMLVNCNSDGVLDTVADVQLASPSVTVTWIKSCADALYSMCPNVNVGVVVMVDGDFYKFYPVTDL